MWHQDIWCMKDCKWPDCDICYLLVYFMEQCPSWGANWFLASQENPCILWNPKVHYPIHKCLPPVPIQASSIQYIPPTSHSLKIHLNIIISIPGSPKWFFPSGFPTKTLHTSFPSPLRATCPTGIILLDFITWTILGEEYRSLSSSLCSFLHSPVLSSLLGPNILLYTLFSNTLRLHSYLNVSEQVSHPYKTTGKIIVLYILIFKFLDSKLKNKRFCTEWQHTFPDFNLLIISSWIEFWFVKAVPKYLHSPILSKELLSIFILWFHPAFWSQDTIMYLLLSAFTSRTISPLLTNEAPMFFFIVCMLPPNILTSSA